MASVSISCTDEVWEEIRTHADAEGTSIRHFIIDSALHVVLAPPTDRGHSLVLSPVEQRALYQRVTQLGDDGISQPALEELLLEAQCQTASLMLLAVALGVLQQESMKRAQQLLRDALGEEDAQLVAMLFTVALIEQRGSRS